MRDRQPTQPGRVKITPENGDSYFAVVEMADDPTEFGTPPTKENLLSDDAEISLFGSAADRTVNDAFTGIGAKLKLIMSDMASITLTVTDQAGNPVKNVLVNGIYSDSGAAVYTDDSGVASGYIAEGSQTISIKNYADLEDISKTLTVVKGSTITEAITATRRNFLKLTASQSIKFSGNATTVDSNPVGGGGAGGKTDGEKSHYLSSGGGGGGGHSVIQEGISVEANVSYQVVVGAGGSTAGASGGTSSFLGVSANGGNGGRDGNCLSSTSASGGTGNGNGASGVSMYAGDSPSYKNGNNGSIGTEYGFSSFTETIKYGGGGGSGTVSRGTQSTYGAGAGYGGNGGSVSYTNSEMQGKNGKDGFGGGGGSGGCFYDNSEDPKTVTAGDFGKGGSGCVAIRIHFDFGDLAA